MAEVQIPKDPGIAAVLSFFVTGLGQIYNGQIGKGILYIRIGKKNGVSPKPLSQEEIEAIYEKYGDPKAAKFVMEL